MRYIIETTKTDAGTRVLPITEDVAEMLIPVSRKIGSKTERVTTKGFVFYSYIIVPKTKY